MEAGVGEISMIHVGARRLGSIGLGWRCANPGLQAIYHGQANLLRIAFSRTVASGQREAKDMLVDCEWPMVRVFVKQCMEAYVYLTLCLSQ